MSGSTWTPGSNPVSNVSGTLVPQTFVAAAGQNTFNIGNFTYTPNTSSLWVFVGGVFQTSGTDFTEAANNQFVFNSNLQGGEIVTCIGMPTVIGATGIGAAASFNSLSVNKNAVAAPAAISAASIVQIVGADASGPVEQLDGFANPPGIAFRRANGTNAIKSALAINDTIGQFSVYGYGATGYSATNRGQFLFQAAENWTDTAQGTSAKILVTPTGSLIPQTIATFTSLGTSIFGGLNIAISNNANPVVITNSGAAGGYGLAAVGAAGAARDIFITGQNGYSNGFSVQYDNTKMLYNFADAAATVAIAGYLRVGSALGGGFTNLAGNTGSIIINQGSTLPNLRFYTGNNTNAAIDAAGAGGSMRIGFNFNEAGGAVALTLSAATLAAAFAGQFAANGVAPAAPPAGYGIPTGPARLINFPGATATLAQTTAQLAQLIIDLKGTGLIAA